MKIFGREITISKPQLPAIQETGLKHEVKALQNRVLVQQMSSITQQIYPTWYIFRDVETYRIMDEVSSVVRFLASTAAKIPLFAYNKSDDELLMPGNKLADFVFKMTYAEKYKMFTWLYLCDECFIFKETVEFGPNKGVINLHYLHPNNVRLVLSEGFPTNIIGYIYVDTIRAIEFTILPEEMIFIRGFNPTIDYQMMWRGQSVISLMCQTLTRLRSGKDTSVAQLQNGGVPGVLYEKNTDNYLEAFDAIEIKGQRDTKLQAFLRNTDNKGAPYTVVGDMGWIAMGTPLADLSVAELAKIDKDAIYNAFAVSNRMFNNSDATGSEKSDDNAQKGLYLNAVQPKTVLVEDALTIGLVPDFDEQAYIKFDFSGIEVLQKNMLNAMQAAAASPVMVPNEVREMQGLDRVNDPLMDKPYLKQGYVPIDEISVEIPDAGDEDF